ncbi:putative transferase At1g60990, chloroplastic isoform X1 [Coffea arabica]|uniref:Transferase At1g60990, chloroplastic isoform X1 n=1 Tax=Coffea arabica TaxID=13443 RepID=A0A6P6VX42_COFAR|nr:putative transferase At1g60990, chloroplastic isoform X1 [Coffea arabica]
MSWITGTAPASATSAPVNLFPPPSSSAPARYSVLPPHYTRLSYPTSTSYRFTRRSRQPLLSYTLSSLPSLPHLKDAFRALPFHPSPPPIDHDHSFFTQDTVTNADDRISIEAFHSDDEALDAAEKGAVVVDLSHYGRIRVGGEDRIQFLHNQSTANFECLSVGQGCDTVFVTPTARTIDIALAWIMKNAITLVVSPVTCESISKMLEKYIFISDKVEIQDITKQTCMFALVGPASNQIMERLGLIDLIGQPYGSHNHYSVNGKPVTVAVGNVISEEGFSFLMSSDSAGTVWKALVAQGAITMGSGAWETFRILQGRPAPGKELTDEFNVLEAHLWNGVSLNKGCYKGQETISRLVTYDGVKQRLWGIRLSSLVEVGSAVTVDGKKVGKLTSITAGKRASEPFGLGYIKRKAASKGDTVIVGGNVVGTVVEVPFLAQQRVLSKT